MVAYLNPENSKNISIESVEQMLHFKFDGRYIYGGLVDGLYSLRDLQIYHVGDPLQPIELEVAYITQNYTWKNFDPAAFVTGVLTDSTRTPVSNIFIKTENVDNDFTNQKGEYNLVFLTEGNYTINIEDDITEYNGSIFVNGVFAEADNSILVSVKMDNIIQSNFVSPFVITNIEKTVKIFIPSQVRLIQNYPNPFNPLTTITCVIPKQVR